MRVRKPDEVNAKKDRRLHAAAVLTDDLTAALADGGDEMAKLGVDVRALGDSFSHGSAEVFAHAATEAVQRDANGRILQAELGGLV